MKEYSKSTEYSLKIRKRIIKLLELVKNKFEYEAESEEDEE